jgi:serine/threonine-protein kinase
VSTFESTCPRCHANFTTTGNQVGRRYRCDRCGMECIIPSQRVDPGAQFGDFTVLYPLGVGASGEVHLAKDSRGRRSALKILFQEEFGDDLDLRRFLRESQFIQSLSHRGLIQLYDAGIANNLHYIAMEFVEGETLDRHLDNFGELAEADALKIIRDRKSVV